MMMVNRKAKKNYYAGRTIFVLLLIVVLFPEVTWSQRHQPVFSKQIITDTLRNAKKLYPIDLDTDGDLDVVAVGSLRPDIGAGTNAAWYENDGFENFTPHAISDTSYGARSTWAADFNNDGYIDILVGGYTGGSFNKSLMLFINDGTPADGGWTTQPIDTADGVVYSIDCVDINDDGNMDIFAAYANPNYDSYGDKVKWYQNNGDGTFTTNVLISNYETASAICISDFDNDNDMDVITAAFGAGPPDIGGDDDISWWENDGNESFSRNSFNIPEDFQAPNSICRADVNNDGYPDLLAAAYFGGTTDPNSQVLGGSLAWWPNNQDGTFGSIQLLVEDFIHARSMVGNDIDGDGDMDAVAAADLDNTILWLENDGSQNFTQQLITNNFSYAYFAYPVDLDGDGDIDIVGSAQGYDPPVRGWEIAFWENNQDEARFLTSGDIDTARFWGSKVIIDFSSGPADTVTVFYNAGLTPDRTALEPGIDHVARKGFYTIVTRTSTSYSADVDFYYGEANVAEWSAITNESELVICVWDNTTSSWTIAGTSQVIDAANNVITVQGITDEFQRFSKWTIGSTTTDNPLPVQLLTFSSTIIQNGIKLTWETASELDNLGFEILKATGQDSSYSLLTDYAADQNLAGAGSSSQGKTYSFTDRSVQNNNLYFYKLNSIAFNGQRSTFGTIKVTYTGLPPSSNFALGQNYPNPFNGYTRIPVVVHVSSASGPNLINLKIFDVLGAEIKNFDLSYLTAGQSELLWDGKDNSNKPVASGQYFYQLNVNGKIDTRRLYLLK